MEQGARPTNPETLECLAACSFAGNSIDGGKVRSALREEEIPRESRGLNFISNPGDRHASPFFNTVIGSPSEDTPQPPANRSIASEQVNAPPLFFDGEILIANKRNTFAKRQREQDKRQRAEKKRTRREQRKLPPLTPDVHQDSKPIEDVGLPDGST
jgi:hypothetical protein